MLSFTLCVHLVCSHIHLLFHPCTKYLLQSDGQLKPYISFYTHLKYTCDKVEVSVAYGTTTLYRFSILFFLFDFIFKILLLTTMVIVNRVLLQSRYHSHLPNHREINRFDYLDYQDTRQYDFPNIIKTNKHLPRTLPNFP